MQIDDDPAEYLPGYWSYFWWECGGGGGGGTGGDGGVGGGGTPGLDPDGDGVIDNWKDVVETDNPCADNFTLFERLGSNYNGPNDIPARVGHPGVDVSANTDDPIHAIMGGHVEFAGDFQNACGYGVQINHADGSWARYCHLTSDVNIWVTTGMDVNAGWRIGSADNSGNAWNTPTHLHITFVDRWGNRDEYFNHTGSQPGAGQFDNGGC